ncbi:Hypothetical predicted protein [Paramuricea clavata]|uniref:Uncharacterized protein n=1 Tax=Paramuricea clavata TaxID=317549 RepID=A0A6S7KC46_PARCT|nr:Hypothetical predicted protein [Paramuricea clavata]
MVKENPVNSIINDYKSLKEVYTIPKSILCSEYNVPADIEMQMFGDDQRGGSLATESNNKLPNSTNDNKDNDGNLNYETTPLSINGNSSIHEISIVETNKESSKENYKPWDQLIVSNYQRHDQNSLQQTNLISPQSFDQVEANCDSNAQQTEFTTYANDNLSNCLEQRQIPLITIADPVFCHAIKPNSISPTLSQSILSHSSQSPSEKKTYRERNPPEIEIHYERMEMSHPSPSQSPSGNGTYCERNRPEIETYHKRMEKIPTRYVRQTIGKATGSDNIPAWCLKRYAEELAPVVHDIVVASIVQCKYPTSYKHAIISPILKIRPPTDLDSDFRQVSVLPQLAKVIEKLQLQLYIQFQDQNKLASFHERSFHRVCPYLHIPELVRLNGQLLNR